MTQPSLHRVIVLLHEGNSALRVFKMPAVTMESDWQLQILLSACPENNEDLGYGAFNIGMRCHQLHKWTRSHWAEDFPQGPGLYAFFHGDELVYIGQSLNIFRRMKAHKLKPLGDGRFEWRSFDSITVRTRVTLIPLLTIHENRLIDRLRPSENIQFRKAAGRAIA